MLIEEIVYLDRDNEIILSLSCDGKPIVHKGLVRVQLLVGDTLLDSQTLPALFDFNQDDRLIIKLGASDLTPGRYHAKLYVFDETHTQGVMWSPLIITVKDH